MGPMNNKPAMFQIMVLVSDKWHAIIQIIAGLIYWRIFASLEFALKG